MMSRDSILLLTMKHYGRVLKFHCPEQNHPLRMWGGDILITAEYLFIRVLPIVVQFDATRFRDNILYSVDCIGPTGNEIYDLLSWLLHFDIQGRYPVSSVNAYVCEKDWSGLVTRRFRQFWFLLTVGHSAGSKVSRNDMDLRRKTSFFFAEEVNWARSGARCLNPCLTNGCWDWTIVSIHMENMCLTLNQMAFVEFHQKFQGGPC
jgi:hypothetical protein